MLVFTLVSISEKQILVFDHNTKIFHLFLSSPDSLKYSIKIKQYKHKILYTIIINARYYHNFWLIIILKYKYTQFYQSRPNDKMKIHKNYFKQTSITCSKSFWASFKPFTIWSRKFVGSYFSFSSAKKNYLENPWLPVNKTAYYWCVQTSIFLHLWGPFFKLAYK